MPLSPLSLVFADGTVVNAAQLNSIVSAINALVSASNTQETQYAALTKSKAIVVATKNSSILTIPGDGSPYGIAGYSPSLNVGSAMNSSSGVITIPETGLYRIISKTLIIANSATSPRAKAWLSSGGTEIALEEDSVPSLGGAFRQSFSPFFYGNLNAGAQITLQIQCWGMTNGSILGDANTFILLERMF